ncbi:LOW QUALITY PROTEIN: hypothetical protein ACHAWO_003488 [Cyclotella atomus]|uniref:Helicase C-terminal domain-containing protein n=1 Tax=Cyclotella atomus TaxID=382360 RepID=A0ABD3PKC2_9STRA
MATEHHHPRRKPPPPPAPHRHRYLDRAATLSRFAAIDRMPTHLSRSPHEGAHRASQGEAVGRGKARGEEATTSQRLSCAGGSEPAAAPAPAASDADADASKYGVLLKSSPDGCEARPGAAEAEPPRNPARHPVGRVVPPALRQDVPGPEPAAAPPQGAVRDGLRAPSAIRRRPCRASRQPPPETSSARPSRGSARPRPSNALPHRGRRPGHGAGPLRHSHARARLTPMAAHDRPQGAAGPLRRAGRAGRSSSTPTWSSGRRSKIVDWLKRRTINPSKIKVCVYDEADNMVSENGHRANSLLIKKQMPKGARACCFRPLFRGGGGVRGENGAESDKIFGGARSKDFGEFQLMAGVLDVIKQLWIDCQSYEGGKLQFLEDIYSLLTIGQSIIFVGTKRDADSVHRTLTDSGYTTETEPWNPFEGRSNANHHQCTGEGVDVDNVCLVVNYDVPVDKGRTDYEAYLHRSGRTGRVWTEKVSNKLIGDQRSIEVLASIETPF